MTLYQQRLLAEGIRIIEKTSPSHHFNADYDSLTFEKALFKRAKLADLRYQISPTFEHFQRLFTLFCSLLAVFFFFLGATSVSQLLINETGAQINFFWALILFLVPHLLSLSIWLLLYCHYNVVSTSWITSFSLSLMTLLDKLHHHRVLTHSDYGALFHYYFKHRLGKDLGANQLSLLSHLWWSCYLLGAILSLLLFLATHQVDFIWQTTILSDATFIWLTTLLTYLPHLFSVNVPDSQDVLLASINIVSSTLNAQEIRISWSNLLFFCLFFYALLPRVLLTCLFYFKLKSNKKSFHLNFDLPYYVQLKNILHPRVESVFISDPDNQITPSSSHLSTTNFYNKSIVIDKSAYPIAIELDSLCLQQAKQHAVHYYKGDLINVLDVSSQSMALITLHSTQVEHIVVYADVRRLPDRGWLSFVKQCRYQHNIQVSLILLGHQEIEKGIVVPTRLQDWIKIAKQANINEQQIMYLARSNDE